MLQQKSLLDGPFKFNLKKNTIVYDQNLFEQEIIGLVDSEFHRNQQIIRLQLPSTTYTQHLKYNQYRNTIFQFVNIAAFSP